ncbi:MAG TPA: hypothetical protein VFE47_10340 [Tepidisphaeraceae bacterium]|jgi:hypothetical protein|nr:hypothetical protein [Tepidisphaeraceae bacterium]
MHEATERESISRVEPSSKIKAVVILTCLVALLAVVSVIVRSTQTTENGLFSDDSFYMLSVSRSIAQGHGPTVDGKTPTNGFQPLFAFICSVPFLLFHSDLANVRAACVICACFFFATGALLGSIARESVRETLSPASANYLYLLTFALYVGSTFVFFTNFNGLETCSVLFLYAAAWRYYQKFALTTFLQAVGFGCILGLLVLARIDAAFFVAVVCLVLLMRGHRTPLSARFSRALIVGLTALIISSPWWIYNVRSFGSLMPISGKAEQKWALDPSRVVAAVKALVLQAAPQLYTGYRATFIATLVRVAIVGFVIVTLFRSRKMSRSVSMERAATFGGCILVTTLLFVGWYTASSWATHFYNRYFAVVSLLAVVAFAMALRQISPGGRAGATVAVVTTMLLCASVVCLQKGWVYQRCLQRVNQLPMVARYVPANEAVGAGQSGALGFFRANVVNLDGKVNPNVPHARGQVPQYLHKLGVNWFCDNVTYSHDLLGDQPDHIGWHKYADDGEVQLYHWTGAPE